MDRDQWARHYARMCTAFGRTQNAEQASAYFEALQSFPDSCVQQAVVRAVRELKHWPHAADLVEAARAERGKLDAPKSSCSHCHCAAWVEGPPRVEPWGTFETAMRCPICWPSARKEPAA